MKTMLIFLVSLLNMTSVHAVLFGHDDRIEIHEAPYEWQELGRSVPAMIPLEFMKKVEGGWVLGGTPIQSYGLCPDEQFSDQRIIANCSASLVGEDLVLTAGHCLDEDRERGCANYAFVFDYKLDQDNPFFVSDDQVYFCEEMIYHQFLLDFTEDIAFVRLTRPVLDRPIIKVAARPLEIGEPLSMIGYPLGTFQKWVEYGEVTLVQPERMSFKHDLDSFSVNSGGPIFSRLTGEQVGVLVRGTGSNIVHDREASCSRWQIGGSSDFAEGNSLFHLPHFKTSL